MTASWTCEASQELQRLQGQVASLRQKSTEAEADAERLSEKRRQVANTLAGTQRK